MKSIFSQTYIFFWNYGDYINSNDAGLSNTGLYYNI